MARSISSAEPEKLFAYADSGVRIDHDLITEASKLASRLQHFEDKCTEPGYWVSAGHVPGELRGHGSLSETIDSWVRQVGKGFQAADQIWIGMPRIELPIGRIRIPLPSVRRFPEWGCRFEFLPSYSQCCVCLAGLRGFCCLGSRQSGGSTMIPMMTLLCPLQDDFTSDKTARKATKVSSN